MLPEKQASPGSPQEFSIAHDDDDDVPPSASSESAPSIPLGESTSREADEAPGMQKMMQEAFPMDKVQNGLGAAKSWVSWGWGSVVQSAKKIGDDLANSEFVKETERMAQKAEENISQGASEAFRRVSQATDLAVNKAAETMTHLDQEIQSGIAVTEEKAKELQDQLNPKLKEAGENARKSLMGAAQWGAKTAIWFQSFGSGQHVDSDEETGAQAEMPWSSIRAGDTCVCKSLVIMQKEEFMDSEIVRRVQEGEELEILGTEPTGQRFMAKDSQGNKGWISAFSKEGTPLLDVTKRPAGVPSAAGSSSASSSAGYPLDAPSASTMQDTSATVANGSSDGTIKAEAEKGIQEKAQKEAEEKAKKEAAEKAQKEAEEKAKKEAEQRAKKEAEEKAKKEAEEKALKEAEEKAKKEAAEKAQKEAEEQAKKEAEEKAQKEAEEKAKKEAEEKAQKEAEEKAKKEAAEKAQKEAEERAKKEAEEQAQKEAEEKAKKEAEEKAQKEAEEKAKKEAEEKAQKEAEEKAKKEAAEKAQKEAEEKAKKEAEEKAQKEAEENAKKEAEEKAQKEAEENAKKEAEERAQKEAEEKAKKEAEEKAQKEAEEKAKKEAEEKAEREAEEMAKKEADEAALADAGGTGADPGQTVGPAANGKADAPDDFADLLG